MFFSSKTAFLRKFLKWYNGFLGKNLNMSIVASIGYCIEVVGKEGQGALSTMAKFVLLVWDGLSFSLPACKTLVPGLENNITWKCTSKNLSNMLYSSIYFVTSF